MPKWSVMTKWLCGEFRTEAAAWAAYNKVKAKAPPHTVEIKRNGAWVIVLHLHDTKCAYCKQLRTLPCPTK